jgi:NAD(P)-dependent dehydrogenase (short-subunit alcohol dehydrogenase family)
MRVLITGGAGFLGSHLSDAFIARGDEVFVLDTGSIAKVRHLLGQPRFQYVHDSIFNVELLDTLISKTDIIYHLAAVVGVEHYVGDPYETLNVNVNGTQNVLKAAYKYNKKVAVERRRRSCARRDHHRPLVLLDIEGGRRAFLLRLSQARIACDCGALFQRLRTAARSRRRRAAVHDLHGPVVARR